MVKQNYGTKQQFGKMAGSVLNSTVVHRLNFCAKLNICASISATLPSCKTLWASLKTKTVCESQRADHPM